MQIETKTPSISIEFLLYLHHYVAHVSTPLVHKFINLHSGKVYTDASIKIP